jgi:hypothetical protein
MSEVSESSFMVYPNPAQGHFTLQNTNNNGVYDLIDITDKVLNTYIMQNTNRMDIHVQIPAGMYFIRERNSGAVQKLVITQ